MKQHLRILILVVMVLLVMTVRGNPATAERNSLSGREALQFLHEVGLTGQLTAKSGSLFPPEGREFFYNVLIGPISGAPDDRFGISVALDGDTLLVGAQLDNINANLDQGSAYVFERDNGRWVFQDYLTASDGAADDRFGFSVALDGDTALIGAFQANIGGQNNQGAAYVFVRKNDGNWNQEDKLVANDGAAGDEFGYAVALDGSTALVGSPQDDINSKSDQGSAIIFTSDGGNWSEQDKLTANDGAASDQLGYAVDLEGDIALLGAPTANINGNNNQGAAYVFTRDGASWDQQLRLVADDGMDGDQFGLAVALTGSTALIGAPMADTFGISGNADAGVAYFFTNEDGSWSQQDKITAFGGAGDRFGRAVDIEGDTAIIGSPRHNIQSKSNQGAAYVYIRKDGAWSQQNKLTQNKGLANDFLGRSVSLSGDYAAVGVPQASYNGHPDEGTVHMYARSPLPWLRDETVMDEDGVEGDYFGQSVALDGNTAIVGSWFAEKAIVFVRSANGWVYEDTLTATLGNDGDQFGYSVALDGNLALVGARAAAVDGDDNRGAVYVFARSGNSWVEQDRLTAADGAEDDQFGWAVTLDETTALIGAPGVDIPLNDDKGRVYAFTYSGGDWNFEDSFSGNDTAAVGWFGRSLSLQGDRALVGAPSSNVSGNMSQGLAFIFERQGNNWVQQDRLKATASDDRDFEFFGSSVALDGDTALVGAPGSKTHGEIDQGIVYYFIHRDNNWILHVGPLYIPVGESEPNDVFGSSLALQGETALVGAPGADTNGVSKGAAYLFTRISGLWIEKAKLTILDGEEFDSFGKAVALDGNTALIGATGVEISGEDNRGEATFFERQPYQLFQPVIGSLFSTN